MPGPRASPAGHVPQVSGPRERRASRFARPAPHSIVAGAGPAYRVLVSQYIGLGREFLAALAERDFPRMARCVADDARLRCLLPGGPVEHRGRDAVIDGFRDWLAGSRFTLVSRDIDELGDRLALRYRAHLVREGQTEPKVIEQAGYCDIGPGGIETLELVCSGYRPLPQRTAARVHDFDAGQLGCADGLAQEFRRRIRSIPVGDMLRVVARDPAAKTDLPPMARMMGHVVHEVQSHDDGHQEFLIERGAQ